jgi:hypothetical protein
MWRMIKGYYYQWRRQQQIKKAPKTLDECIAVLRKWPGIDEFKQMDEYYAVDVIHYSTGMWVRNNWGLWSGSPLKSWFNDLGIKHPDDMSGIIFTSLHRVLNGKPIELDEQIAFYKHYWAEYEKGQ